MLVALGTTPSYSTLLPEGDVASGSVSLVAYITDRFHGRTRATTVVGVGSLAAAFSASAFGRRALVEEGPDAFADFVLNISSNLLGGAALVGDSEGAVGNVANIASVANSPRGGSAMSQVKTQELLGGLVGTVLSSSASIEVRSAEEGSNRKVCLASHFCGEPGA